MRGHCKLAKYARHWNSTKNRVVGGNDHRETTEYPSPGSNGYGGGATAGRGEGLNKSGGQTRLGQVGPWILY